jgi:hypothetical protein
VTWKLDTIFNFGHIFLCMLANGTTCIYTCCIVGKVHICGKIVFLALGFAKRDYKSA